jgi:hypothetical protein
MVLMPRQEGVVTADIIPMTPHVERVRADRETPTRLALEHLAALRKQLTGEPALILTVHGKRLTRAAARHLDRAVRRLEEKRAEAADRV